MIYLNAFIMCGLFCALGQIIIDNTNLTPGHVNVILVLIGALLSFFGLYDLILSWSGAGASVPITNFGHLLFKGAYEGFTNDGMTGLLNGLLKTTSGGLSVTIIMAFIVAIFTKPQN